jgi:hypothetical protein
VSAWRKLKRLGAILFQDTLWVLPHTARTQEQFQWLAAEIAEMGGEAALWKSQLLLPGMEDSIVAQFQAQVDEGYAELVAYLEQPDSDRETLSRQYQQLQQKDYFHSPLGRQVRELLLMERGAKS